MKLLIDNIKRTIIFKDNKAFYKNKKLEVDVTLFFKKSKDGISVLKKKYSHMLVSENKKIIYGGADPVDPLQFNLNTADIEDVTISDSTRFRKLISLYLMAEIYTSDGILTREIDKDFSKEAEEEEGEEGEVDAKEKKAKVKKAQEKATVKKAQDYKIKIEEEEKEIGKWELVKLTLRELIDFIIAKTYNIDALIHLFKYTSKYKKNIEKYNDDKLYIKNVNDLVNNTMALYSAILKKARIKKTYNGELINKIATALNFPNFSIWGRNTLRSENPKNKLVEKVLSSDKIKTDIYIRAEEDDYIKMWYCSYLLIEAVKKNYKDTTNEVYNSDDSFLKIYISSSFLAEDKTTFKSSITDATSAIELLKIIKDTFKVINKQFIDDCKKYYKEFLWALSQEQAYKASISSIYPQITKDMLDELILYKLINIDTQKQLFEDPAFKILLDKTYTGICKIMNLYNEVYSRTKEKENTRESNIPHITTKRAIIPN
jgi:hypothetical protein